MDKLRKFLNCYWDILVYVFFGVLTTAVDFVIYAGLHYLAGCSGAFSNGAAWCGSVIFAFATNKAFVFHSRDWSWPVLLPEAGKFIGARVLSGLGETGAIGLTVDLWGWNAVVMKLMVGVIAALVNYIASRWLVFSEKE